MGGVEGIGNRADDGQDVVGLEWTAPLQQGRQVAAADESHRDVQQPVHRPGFVDRDDVRVIKRCGEARLPEESLTEVRTLDDVLREHLQGDPAVQPQVDGLVHDGHAASAEHRRDLIGAEFRAGPEIG